MSVHKRVSLADVADIIDSRHKTPKYSDKGFPMVRVVDVSGGKLNLVNCKLVDEKVYTDFSKDRDPQVGDLVISRVGSYGNISYVNSNVKFCLGQNTALIVPSNKVNWRYLYYQLTSPLVSCQIENLVVGAVQKTISIKSIKSLECRVPPLPEQKAIAHILGTLDDKIELNRQMNETLEQMAQALFQSWFVDFDPVIDKALDAGNPIPEPLQKRAQRRKELGEKRKPLPDYIAAAFPDRFVFTEELGWIPEGWEDKTINDLGNVVGGGTPSNKVPEYFTEDGIPWLSPKDLSGYNWKFISKGEKDITELGLNKSSAKLIPKGTVLFSSRAPIGYTAVARNSVCTNQGFKSVVPKESYFTEYIYQFLLWNKYNIESIASGSTFKEVSGKVVKGFPALLPSHEILKEFSSLLEPNSKRQKLIEDDSNLLIKLRDTLLPKLISGELRVPDAEKLVAEYV